MTDHVVPAATEPPPFNPAALFRALRPRQWTKNTFVFAGIIFAQRFTEVDLVIDNLWVFLMFCMASSGIYLINDWSDVEEDRLHPKKRLRPIASGQVSESLAISVAVLLLLGALALSLGLFLQHPWVFGCMVIYIVKEILYTFVLKHVVIMDILINSIGFPLRAIAGIVAIQPLDPTAEPVVISTWFLACIFFLSLFIAVCKRRHEVVLLRDDAKAHRAVLAEYSRELLDQLVAICTSATVICYTLYTILKMPGEPEAIQPSGLSPMVWTVPFVIFGIFRYLYLVYSREEGGAPEQMILDDWWLLGDVVAWLGVAIAVMLLT